MLVQAEAGSFTGGEDFWKAVIKSQAIIAFNSEGIINFVNEQFLSMFGYEIQEVEGSHHSLLCDPEYCTSDAYNVFWEKLRRGEYHSGEYKRVGKDGKTVWIQATYNPIMGDEGCLWKVVKLAVDVTEQKITL